MVQDEGRPRRCRVGLLALALLLVLALVGEALTPAIVAAERPRDRRDRDSGVNTEVVGGQPVAQGTFTFMTLVRISVPGGFLRCGGSLIDELYVLTAAHCVEDTQGNRFQPGQFTLYLGKAFWQEAGSANTRGVAAITQHPEWDRETDENDVAVLELTSPVPATVAKPIPFVDAGETRFDAPGQGVTVAGWGTTASGGVVSNQLRAANLAVVGDAACDAAYVDFGGIEAAVMVCAAFTGRDSCQGDSGGPLFAREVIGFDIKKKKKKKGHKRKKVRIPIYRDVQMGIVSFGVGCAEPGFPGVYTRLSAPDINDFIVEVADP